MTTTLTIPGTLSKLTATVDVPTSEYGTPRPTLTLRVLGEVHHKAVQALAHQVASHIELALLARRCESIVEMESGCGYAYQGKTRIGSQVRIALELVGDERKLTMVAEEALAKSALDEVAKRINSSRVE